MESKTQWFQTNVSAVSPSDYTPPLESPDMSDCVLNTIYSYSNLVICSILFLSIMLSFFVAFTFKFLDNKEKKDLYNDNKEDLSFLQTGKFFWFVICFLSFLCLFYGWASLVNEMRVIDSFFHNLAFCQPMSFENSIWGIELLIVQAPPRAT